MYSTQLIREEFVKNNDSGRQKNSSLDEVIEIRTVDKNLWHYAINQLNGIFEKIDMGEQALEKFDIEFYLKKVKLQTLIAHNLKLSYILNYSYGF